jgi:hypothetical protein
MVRIAAILCWLSISLFSHPAWALPLIPPEKPGIGRDRAGVDVYRIGDEWGRRLVTEKALAEAKPEWRRAAFATARVGGATGFILGEFQGVLILATNHHVLPTGCPSRAIRFTLLSINTFCDRWIGSWPEIDLALVTLRLANEGDRAKLTSVAQNFSYETILNAGRSLMMFGFGGAENPMRRMQYTDDSDCKIFSRSGTERELADPDRLNPGSYSAWSFALGCDVSHGDSGSAILDRESGRVLGVVWTGGIPKSRNAQDSKNLDLALAEQSDLIWTDLTYGVPAIKIRDRLLRAAEEDGAWSSLLRNVAGYGQ